MLLAFAAVVAQAEVRILVLDPHFDTVGVAALGPALDSCRAQDVRLLTSGSDIERQQRESLRRGLSQHLNLNQSYAPRLEVRWNANLDRRSFPFLHDRFAVVDSDLWHFGSNVGGGHPGLTAASGPWSATAARAAEFFEECWGSCNA